MKEQFKIDYSKKRESERDPEGWVFNSKNPVIQKAIMEVSQSRADMLAVRNFLKTQVSDHLWQNVLKTYIYANLKKKP